MSRRTGEIPNALLSRVLSCQFRRFGREIGRRLSVLSKYELPNAVLSIDGPVPQIQEQRVEVQRGNSQERLQQNPQERSQQHTVEYGVSNSSLEFGTLREQAEIAELMAKEAGRMPTVRRLWKDIRRSRSVTKCSKHPSELAP